MAKRAAALHILVKTKDQCLDIKKQIDKGANFQQMAKKYSTCPSKKKGGDLGEFAKGQMVPAFDKAVFNGPELAVQGPIKTSFGFHLIKVLYRR